MSRLSDYSKFDHLEEDDDDDDDDNNIDNGTTSTNTGGYDTTISDSTTSVPIHEIISPVINNNNHNNNTTNSNGISLKVGPSVRMKETQRKSSDSSATGGSAINLQQQQQQQQQDRYRFIYEYNGQPIYEWEQGLSEVIMYVYCPTNRIYHSSDFVCTIHPSLIQLGLKGSSTNNGSTTNTQYFINEQTYEKVDVHESTWTIEEMEDDDNELNSNNNNSRKQCIVFYLQKVAKGIVWKASLRGQPVPPTSSTGTNTGSTIATTTTNTTTTTTTTTNTTTMIELDLYTYQLVQQQVLKERWQEENPSMDFSSATFNGSVPDPRSFMGGVRY